MSMRSRKMSSSSARRIVSLPVRTADGPAASIGCSTATVARGKYRRKVVPKPRSRESG
jgi:hypothetical protein